MGGEGQVVMGTLDVEEIESVRLDQGRLGGVERADAR